MYPHHATSSHSHSHLYFPCDVAFILGCSPGWEHHCPPSPIIFFLRLMSSMLDWGSDSSSFSRAFSSSSSELSQTAEEVSYHVTGVHVTTGLAQGTSTAASPSERRVCFRDPSEDVQEIEDVEEVGDPSLLIDLPHETPSDRAGSPASTLASVPGTSPKATCKVDREWPSPQADAPPPPAERLMEPTRPPGTKASPGIQVLAIRSPQRHVPDMPESRTTAFSHELGESEPIAPVMQPLSTRTHCSHTLNSSHAQSSPSPKGTALPLTKDSHASENEVFSGSSTPSERRPVNERAASAARASCTAASAAMLASYQTVKRNVRVRLVRRYYDKWMGLLAAPSHHSRTDAAVEPMATPLREARGTQTDLLWNTDVESCSSISRSTSPRHSGGGVREVLCGCSDEMSRSPSPQQGNSGTDDVPQRDPPSPPVAGGPRPMFQYSPQPAPVEGIAARSRPAGQLCEVKKSDLPRRKGRSPSRAAPSVGLPSVVANPLRVHRK